MIRSLRMQLLLLLESGERASERINIQPPVPQYYILPKISPHLFSAVDMVQIKEGVYFQTWAMHLEYKPTTSR